jgi:hypothetical protein
MSDVPLCSIAVAEQLDLRTASDEGILEWFQR